MNIAVYSLFRDNEEGNYIENYYKTHLTIADASEHDFRWYMIEGDSKDDTFGKLQFLRPNNNFIIRKHDTDRGKMEATDAQYRLQTLAEMYNFAIDMIVNDGWADYAWLVESDLIFPDPTILKQMLANMPKDAAVIAPMIWIKGRTGVVRFYDIWGYRAFPNTFPGVETRVTPHGEELQYFPPAMPVWYQSKLPTKAVVEVAAACACFLTRKESLYGNRCTDEDETAGLQYMIRNMGRKIYIDTSVYVMHPLMPWHNI